MIIVDSREGKDIEKEAREHFKNVEVETLFAGDIVCPIKSIGIERKEIKDFAQSVINKRIFKQAVKMKNNFEYAYIIIIGNDEVLYRDRYIKFGENRFISVMAELMAIDGLKVIWVQNRRQFWKIVKSIFKKTKTEKNIDREFTTKKISGNNVDLSIICQVPGIGPKMGRNILKQFTLLDLFYVREKDLRQIKGIGKTHSEAIKKVFRGDNNGSNRKR